MAVLDDEQFDGSEFTSAGANEKTMPYNRTLSTARFNLIAPHKCLDLSVQRAVQAKRVLVYPDTDY